MLKKVLGIGVGIITLGAIGLNLVLRLRTKPGQNSNQVLEVLDGDTFRLASKQRVRLFDIDAPELGLCGSLEAKDKLSSLVLGKSVNLQQPVTDDYNRIVALVYVNDQFINKIMIEDGYGRYESKKFSGSEILSLASKTAKEKKLGIYGPKCFQLTNPDNPKCLIKGNVNIDDKTKIYHFPGCSGYPQVFLEKFKGDQWFCTEAEAVQAGFTKSINCHGRIFSPP